MNRIVSVLGAAIFLSVMGVSSSLASDKIIGPFNLATETSWVHWSFEMMMRERLPGRVAAVSSIAWTPIASETDPIAGAATERTIRVFFEFDAVSAEIGVLAEYIPAGTSVLITGHTDAVGTTHYNQQLGMRRAQFIADRLREAGIERSRLTVDSRGEFDPIADNDTVVGRAKNRRVDVRVTR